MDVAASARPLPPASPAALLDSLRYPLQGGALAAVVTLAVLRVGASFIPLVGLLFDLICALALYKYALEAFAASGLGRRTPPDVLSHVDTSTHNRHLWVQLLVMAALVACLILAPQWRHATALAAALVLPGLIFALAIAQNLPSALNPLNWWVVARRIGVGYPLLVLGWWLQLVYQIEGYDLFAWLPGPLSLLAFYLLLGGLTIALFRWQGLFLQAHARRLGFDASLEKRPELAREREQREVSQNIRHARELGDPAQRAAQLREAVARGGDDSVQRDYRDALRAAGKLDALGEHARVRCCELIVLARLQDAADLAREALLDDPGFTLPECAQLEPLLDHLERARDWASAAALSDNYGRRFPRRRDAVLLSARTAWLYCDQLDRRDEAARVLDAALAQAEALGLSEDLQRLRTRLRHGLRLRSL